MYSIDFHEDDYCQIEILLIENIEFCMRQAGLISEFSNEHLAGAGWNDVFIRAENPISLHEKKISVKLLEKSLEGVIRKIDVLYTGFGSYRKKCKNTKAFGENKNVVLFFEEKGKFVTNIWLTLDVCEENDITLAKNMLTALSSIGNFIIADWGWNFVKDINQSEDIEQYLRKRLVHFQN